MINGHRGQTILSLAVLFMGFGELTARADSVASKPAAPPVSIQLSTSMDSTGSDVQETALGDLMADAVFETGGVDAAFVSADELVPLKLDSGKHSIGDFLNVLRNRGDSSNRIVVLTLTGEQIVAAANRSVSRIPLPFDGYLQISHMQIHYKANEPVAVRVASVEIGGSPVDLKRTYQIATTRPLANGSFGYFRVWDDKAVTKDTGVGIADCLTAYLNAHRSLNDFGTARISKE